MSPDVLQFVKDYGPAFLGIVGSIIASLLGALGFLLRIAWRRHAKAMVAQAKSIEHLAEALQGNKESSRAEHGKIWEALQAFRAESHLTKNGLDYLKSGLLASEGAMKHQTSRIDAYIERMGQLDAKIEAVFRWLDANKRATDTKA